VSIQLRVIGCGDAFGSDGRFQACFLVRSEAGAFLIDCGATSMTALRRLNVDPNEIGTIFISHLHGDHFGGLPFLILDARLVSDRKRPLTLAGPPGLQQRLFDAMEILFHRSTSARRSFDLEIIELVPDVAASINGITVTPYLVSHHSGAPPYAFRFEIGGKVMAYSGDTEPVETLMTAARNADLFVAECYTPTKTLKYHLDLQSLRDALPEIAARRIVLVHMNAEMLGHPVPPEFEKAHDGMIIEL
jgi:ribonuclease BN (tRNA processing enzyme)